MGLETNQFSHIFSFENKLKSFGRFPKKNKPQFISLVTEKFTEDLNAR